MRKFAPFALGAAVVTALTLSPLDFRSPCPSMAYSPLRPPRRSTSISSSSRSPRTASGSSTRNTTTSSARRSMPTGGPIRHGHWIYMKNYGWYFASDEPFAWAVYHYGRWFHDQKARLVLGAGQCLGRRLGRLAPQQRLCRLGPARADRDGFAVNVDITNQEPPQHDWVFVPPKRFLEPQARRRGQVRRQAARRLPEDAVRRPGGRPEQHRGQQRHRRELHPAADQHQGRGGRSQARQ